MAIPARRGPYAVNIWPGFVDALASILMVFIFMLVIFVLAQFFLRDTLAGRNRALETLTQRVDELAEVLSLERRRSEKLRTTIDQLNTRLEVTLAERGRLGERLSLLTEQAKAAVAKATKLETVLADTFKIIDADRERIELQLREIVSLQADITALRRLRKELERQVGELAAIIEKRDEALLAARDRSRALEARLADQEERTRLAQFDLDERDIRLEELTAQIASTRQSLAEEQKLSASAQAQVTALNQQIAALREQITRLSATLTRSEDTITEQKVKIAELGHRLNVALADKVQELSRYRSEFFGRLREILGEHPDIRIIGDRFLFQSELLFATGSAELGPDGKRQIARLAETLTAISRKIPSDIDWILRIDGHADRRPIRTAQFSSNWELSTARALSIVNYLITQGIPPKRLAATGFGEFRPLNDANTQVAFTQNRRIEIKLTQP